jgi:hypothetical protein
MSENTSEPSLDPERRSDKGHADPKEHPKGTLDPAPTTPTDEKQEPEAGTGSAHKHSPENPDEPTSTGRGKPGDSGRETEG